MKQADDSRQKERQVMKKGLTEVVFILDRSGSMGGLESDTIGGFNSMLKKQQEEEGEAIFSTVLFDDQVEILHDRIKIGDVRPITNKEYNVRGCTALLDALGGTIRHIKDVQKALDKEERPEKTLIIVTTDGLENASKKFTFDKVRKLVEKQREKHGWEFLFLGANMDAIQVAGQFGIDSKRVANFHCDSVGTKLNYDVLSRVVSCSRMAGSADAMHAAFEADEILAPIHEDFERRQKRSGKAV